MNKHRLFQIWLYANIVWFCLAMPGVLCLWIKLVLESFGKHTSFEGRWNATDWVMIYSVENFLAKPLSVSVLLAVPLLFIALPLLFVGKNFALLRKINRPWFLTGKVVYVLCFITYVTVMAMAVMNR